MKKCHLSSLVAGVFLCASLFVGAAPGHALQSSAVKKSPVLTEVQKERDSILCLLTLAFVYNEWQSAETLPQRGHNIGSVLVNQDGIPVFWTRNSVKALHNSNQHGEVRMATRYLSNIPADKYMPKGYVLYTSLEPCAMCTGMLSMVQTGRVVYVQKDPEFGGVAEALKSIGYPRVYEVLTPAALPQKVALEQGWDSYKKNGGKAITDYLLTPQAKGIYQSAQQELKNYSLKYKENDAVLQAAKLLAQSKLPELIGADGKAQKVWQKGNPEFSGAGSWEYAPALFIEYLDWNRQRSIAQVVDDKFYICTTEQCVKSDKIQYLNSGKQWSAQVANGIFTHSSGSNHSHQDGIIVYQDWSNKAKNAIVRDILLPD